MTHKHKMQHCVHVVHKSKVYVFPALTKAERVEDALALPELNPPFGSFFPTSVQLEL